MRQLTSDQEIKDVIHEDQSILFFYTPFCQNCKIAERMLRIVAEARGTIHNIYTCDLNHFPWMAEMHKIQSVPALTVFKNGKIGRTLFAFESVIRVDQFLEEY
ncbi:thioredoxin family protein [Pseudalkalibacillus hwajinpoensis]|uniref:thioredoxin family protein n=1 Tax=Guptibacillus hwajinpoensis TaxID=208199 RepID=UPI00325BFF06